VREVVSHAESVFVAEEEEQEERLKELVREDVGDPLPDGLRVAVVRIVREPECVGDPDCVRVAV
jgi:hypothetical protein